MEFSDLVKSGIIKVKDNQSNAQLINISNAINKRIKIYDYKTNLSTKFGEDRCLIFFTFIDEPEINYKVYTTSKVLIDIISQVPKNVLPFNTTIELIKGKKFNYYNFS